MTTVAGTGVYGYAEGAATMAMFANPWGVSVDSNGVLFVADYLNCMIRKVTTAGGIEKEGLLVCESVGCVFVWCQ